MELFLLLAILIVVLAGFGMLKDRLKIVDALRAPRSMDEIRADQSRRALEPRSLGEWVIMCLWVAFVVLPLCVAAGYALMAGGAVLMDLVIEYHIPPPALAVLGWCVWYAISGKQSETGSEK